MVYFGPLAAEIVSLVWGTPRNFNGFRVLAALLHGTLVVGIVPHSSICILDALHLDYAYVDIVQRFLVATGVYIIPFWEFIGE